MKIAVYCGSSAGTNPLFTQAAQTLGHHFAHSGIDLVYGGGKVGLMGTIADAVLEAGGKVYGIIPQQLKDKEIAHPQLTQLQVVADMHQRKATMAEMADAFVAMPGGTGTLEEIFESWTWAQLGYHQKPCAFYDVANFYAPLFNMLENMSDTGFINPDYIQMLIRTDNPETLITSVKNYQPPKQKWS